MRSPHVVAFAVTLVPSVVLAQERAPSVTQAPATELASTIVPKSWLVLPAVDATGRRPFDANAAFARYVLDRASPAPKKGDVVKGDLGEDETWTEVAAKDDGTVDAKAAWACTTIESPAARVMIANLQGGARLYVNGDGFEGDVYGYGFRGVPIALRAGTNVLYVAGIRGAFRLELWTPPSRVIVGDWDVTKPDLVANTQPGLADLGVLLLNASNAPATPSIGCGDDADPAHALFQRGTSQGPAIPPLGVAKPMVEGLFLRALPKQPTRVAFPLVVDGATRAIELAVVPAGDPRRITFPSRVDGSTQECSVFGAKQETSNVVLTLHGAGVDARNQVGSYSLKDDFAFVAPTNRRPFGFDWQDWGRSNAYEALDAGIAPKKRSEVLVYLTGHSMGGHGTWHLAANDPWSFVAIAPSAGWATFDTYNAKNRGGELADTWHAADRSSDTAALIANLAKLPTFVLHGEADDNVPVGEALWMQERLRAAGAEPKVHVQPAAGHWWDGDAAKGADCVDWPGIFELFREAKPRPITSELDFTCADVGVQSSFGWCELLQAIDYAKPLRVSSRFDAATRELVIRTENVRAFKFRAMPADWRKTAIVLDDTRIEMKAWDFSGAFVRDDAKWTTAPRANRMRAQKSPELSGPFKRVFDRGFVLVYGTAGDEREDAELLARARCDAEAWWYRANGNARVVSDEELVKGGLREWTFGLELEAFVPNLVLYGNADTNSAWKRVFGAEAPVQASRGAMKVGEREWKGDGLAALFVAPRRDAQGNVIALAGAFADSGPAGSRLGYVTSPFRSGVGYPDYVVFDRGVLAKGAGGVLATGFLDADWKLDGRGFARAEEKK